jgi:hypothetical protein
MRTPAASRAKPARSRTPDVPQARIALMSHQATFAVQMRRAGFEVSESQDIDALTAAVAGADVVVIDLVGQHGKRGPVARLGTILDSRVPVFLISADEVDAALLGPHRPIDVIVPPVGAEYLAARVRQVLRQVHAVPPTRPAVAAAAPPVVTPVAGAVTGPVAGGPAEAKPVSTARKVAAPASGPASRKAGTPTAGQSTPPQGGQAKSGAVTAAGSRPTAKRAAPAGTGKHAAAGTGKNGTAGTVKDAGVTPAKDNVRPLRARRLGRRGAPDSATRPPKAPAAAGPPKAITPSGRPAVDMPSWAPPTLDWRVMCSQLAHAVREIPAVREEAQAIAEELAAAAGGDAVVMVRDLAGLWRVEGGAGLRSFEWAQTLEDVDWIVQVGRGESSSLLVMDTDAVRGDLVGTPLASRHQLVRTLSTVAPFLVCAAWDGPGDSEKRVQHVVDTAKRHESAMTDAISLRDFVRTLSRRLEGDAP